MSGGERRRVAIVLGAGGVVGHAFHVGVLSALADEFGWDARSADLMIGTSAGSTVGASLRAGLHPLDLRRRAMGQALTPDGAAIMRRAVAAADAAGGDGARSPGEDIDSATESALAVLARRLRIASPERVRLAVRAPWDVTAGSLLSAMLPPGRRSTRYLGAPYDAAFGDGWPPGLWIVAVALDVGRRIVFGRDDEHVASVGAAVEASCAIPGYFAPVTVAGERYVDGAVHSTTNADVAADWASDVDLVIISAPMSAVSGAVPRSQTFSLRQLARRQIAGEVALLRSRGVEVVTFQPTGDDVAEMIGDSMDAAKGAAVCARIVTSTRAHVATPTIAERLRPFLG